MKSKPCNLQLDLVVLTVLCTGIRLAPIAQAAAPDVPKLIEQLRDPATQTQASLALVDVGMPAVKPLIDAACTKGLDMWARDTLLRVVMRARDEGGPKLDRAKIEALLIETVKNDQRAEARALAVRMLGLIGRDPAVPAVAALLKDNDCRQDAIATLQQIPGKPAADALVAFAKTAAPPDRCSAIQSLGLRGCKVSVNYLMQAARDSDVAVQVEAVKALGQTGDLSALPLVQEIAEQGAAQVKPAAMEASLRLAEAAVRAGKKDQAMAVYDRAMTMIKDRLGLFAAIAGYARVAGNAGTSRLIEELGRLGSDADRQIMGELTRMPGRDVTDAIVRACKKVPAKTKAMLITVLGRRRDPAGYAALIAAAKDDDESIRAQAVCAIADTREPSMDGVIRDAIYKGTPKVKAAAADAYVVVAERLLRQDKVKNEANILKTFNDVLGMKVNDATKVAALEGLALLANPTSAGAVEKLLADPNPQVRGAAARAYLAIAPKMNLKKDAKQTAAILKKLIDAGIVPPGQMQNVLQHLRATGDKSNVAEKLGMITHWWVIGPWPSPEWSAFDKTFFPEKEIDLAKTYKDGDRELKWKPVVTASPEGRVDLRASIQPDQSVAAYGYAEVTSDQDQDVLFCTGSDDGMKLWVNGKVVFAKNEPRGLAVDMDTIPARLQKGVNKILIKVLNGGGGWEFCARVTTKDGKPVKLRVRPAK
ncbi:MAG: HEAT repeat domain-containing protein [Phycisphaerae bacterium]|nr:HEAT repeat domain-containing protein [Phycisphaerae bacterium]